MPELIHSFRLPVPVARAWAALDDPDLVAAAFPGATVRDRGADSVSGQLAVKVGPVTTRYDGTVTVSWRDRPARRFVLTVVGDEVGGAGQLAATIHVTLAAVDEETDVEVRSNLGITGRVGQFGEGILSDVLERMLADLATGLIQAGFPERRCWRWTSPPLGPVPAPSRTSSWVSTNRCRSGSPTSRWPSTPRRTSWTSQSPHPSPSAAAAPPRRPLLRRPLLRRPRLRRPHRRRPLRRPRARRRRRR